MESDRITLEIEKQSLERLLMEHHISLQEFHCGDGKAKYEVKRILLGLAARVCGRQQQEPGQKQ